MIIRHTKISDGDVLRADVCVLGAGAAGITTAIELARAGVDVVLIPGGGFRYSPRYQRLYKGTDDWNIPLERARMRRFGGTTTVWGGRCIPFDPIDFEQRPWVSNSGWPIKRSDLEEYYRRSQDYLDIGTTSSYDVATVLPDAPPHLIESFNDDVLTTDRIEKWSLPTDFGKKYRREIKNSSNLRAIMHSHLVEIAFNGDPTKVSEVLCLTKTGARFTCEARSYVLAMGALEVTRHLLQPSELYPTGIGNRSGLLGKYFMTHISGAIAEIAFKKEIKIVNRYEVDAEGVYCRRRLQISGDAQREAEILNFGAFLHDPPLHDPGHRDPVLSLLFWAKGLRAVALRIPAEYSAELAYGRFGFGAYAAHLRNIVIGLPKLLASAPGLVYKRLIRRRKLPSVILEKKDNRFSLWYHVEHAPHRESRVTLSHELDEHGLRRLHVSMRYKDIDVESILKAHEIIKDRLERSGVGTLGYVSDDPRADIERQIGFGGHQLGTTRMAVREEEGVVDTNCRVFGTDNLYVASPSVFPTGSHANPVLTIVAMAIRLTDHLCQTTRAHQ